MSKFRIWTADGSSKDVSRKLLTRVHATRPKKSFYSKLRYQPIIDDEGNEDANKRRDRIPLSRLRRPKTLHYSAVDDDDSSTLDDDEEEEEEVCNDFDEMNRHRQRKRSRSCGDQNCDRRVRDWEIDFVDREIEEGDTLCSLALRYGCKMSEIKRVNNLINDQEFYGLRKIKVPVKKHSFTKEQLEREVEEGRRRRLLDESLHAYTSKNVDDGRVENGGDTLERVICVRNSRDSKKFLQTMDEDLERIRQKVKVKKDSLEEVARSLTRKRFRPIVARERPGGRHWDIPKVHCLVVVAVVTLVAFPIILYLLLAHWKANS